MVKLDRRHIRHKKRKILVCLEVIARLHVGWQAETVEGTEFGEIAPKRLEPVLFLGIGVTPALKTNQ